MDEVRRCGALVAGLVVTAGIRHLLDPLLGERHPYTLFIFPALFAASRLGWRHATAALVVGLLAANFLFVRPRLSFQVEAASDQVGALLYGAVGVTWILLVERTRRAQETLRQRQARLLDHTYDPILTWDLDGTATSWNRAAERLYGFTASEVMGRPIHELLGTELPEGREALLARLRRDRHWEGELRQRTKAGEPIVVDARMALVAIPDGPERVLEAVRDVTARRRANAAAERALAQLETVVSSLVDGLVVADASGNLLEWNPAALRMHGYTSLDDVRRNLRDFTRTFALRSPDGQSLPLEEWPMSRVLRGETLVDQELRVQRVDTGLELTISYSGGLVPQPGDAPALAVLTLHDVTERRRAEAAHRASEARFRMLVDALQDHAIYLLDPEGKVATWSGGAQRLKGYAADEVLGRSFSIFYPPEAIAAGAPARHLDQARREGRAEDEGWRVRKDGSRFWANVVIAPLHAEPGQPQGFAKITRDLTERRSAEALLSSVLHNVIDGIVGIDEEGTVRSFNRAAERLLGYSLDEVIGRNVKMLMPEPYRSEHDGYLANYRRTGDAKIIGKGREAVAQRKDGSTFPIDLSISEFHLDERRYFTGVIRDITDRRALERQLQQSQKMEAMGQLAGGVAHDFNNLLTVILGYGELAVDQLPPEHPARSTLVQVTKAADRAAALTRQLLAFSRREVIAPRVLDLNALVADLDRMLRRLIGEDIEFATVLQPGLWPVEADPGQLEQVVVNFAVNARDAMPRGGKLTVETRNVELDPDYARRHSSARAGRHVMLAVSDTGCGMTPEVRARIFEPFFTTKEVGQGTGLGLATVYGIVKQAGGHIEVYSEVAVGTSFKVYLPRVERGDERDAPASVAPAAGGHETILLVEDEDGVRDLSRTVLAQAGYHVLEATDGLDALRVAGEHGGPIHALVSDVVMPRLGGRELGERLLALHPGLKVLYLSGYTNDAVLRHGVLHGSASFLQKPYLPAALVRKVREVLDGGPPEGTDRPGGTSASAPGSTADVPRTPPGGS